MNRSFQTIGFAARAVALAFAITFTGLIVGVNMVDLSTLGGHDVTVASKWPDASNANVASAR